MNHRSRLLGGMVIACLCLTLYMVVDAPAASDLVTVTDTTLEDFNTGELYHTGLTREHDGEVRLLVVGIAGEWMTDTNSDGLPARDRHAAVHHQGHIIVVGGKEVLGLTGDVYYTTINPEDHDLADWNKTNPLPSSIYPNGLSWHASVVVHDRIYILGGYDDTNVVEPVWFNTVLSAPIHSDGTVGAWSAAMEPLPQGLYLHQAAVVNDRIYVIGGRTPGGGVSNKVYFASPDPTTGQITSWTETAPFPYATRGHMAAVQDQRIYVMGGTELVEGETVVSAKVHYAQPDPASGLISSWKPTTNMRNNVYGGAGLAWNDVLFSTAGAIDQFSIPSAYVGASLIDASGSLVEWLDTSVVDPSRFYHAAVHSDDGWLYVIHGNTGSGGRTASINRGSTSGPGGTYAPDGTYTSRTVVLPRGSELKELRWNTTVNDPAVTSIDLWYRTRLTASDDWPAWSGPYSPGVQGTVTHTLELHGYAGYFQYRADFATSDSHQTPVLNAVQLLYLPPVLSINLSKNATPPSGSVVYPEDIVRYTLTYSNSLTGLTATDSVILDMLPADMQYLTGSIYGLGADDSDPYELHWNLGDVAPGSQGEVGFEAVVREDPQVVIQNQALLFTTAGPVQYSNWVSHTTALLGPVLEVRKEASPPRGSQVLPGSRITYTITYSNPSIFLAEGAVLSDTYDPHESYGIVSTVPQPSDEAGAVWQLGDVKAGESGEINIAVDLAEVLPNHWIVSNTVDLHYERMIQPATDVVTHMVVYNADTLTDFVVDDLSWQPGIPAPGDEITFYATITNQGAAAADQYFWVSLYIKPQPSNPPLGPWDHLGGYCLDASCDPPRPHYLAYVPSLAPGASVQLSFQDLEWDPTFSAAGAYDIYVQADMAFGDPAYNMYWGRYAEDYEQNNLWHEALIIPSAGPSRIYLPLVSCSW